MKILTWGIYLVVFCLPLYLVRFMIFGIPTTVLEILIYILFLLWLVEGGNKNLKIILKNNKLLIFGIVFLFIGVSLATIFSLDLRTSAGIWKAWFVDPILFFIVLISVIKNSEQVKKVLFSLFLSGIVVSIIALIYLILGELDPVGRLQAFYTSPNYLAMYLVPALIIGFWSLLRSKTYFLAPTLLLAVILFFTRSFSSWLAIITVLGFSLFIYLFKSRKKYAWLILVAVLIIILILGYLALTQRESSLNARLIIWQKAWEIFTTHPILGIGPGTFGNYFLPSPEWGVPQPHNIFLAFLLQTGLIGFLGFVLLLIYFFRPKADQPRAGSLQLLLMMIMACILIHGLTDTLYWKNDIAVVFWVIIGSMVILSRPQSGSRQESGEE